MKIYLLKEYQGKSEYTLGPMKSFQFIETRKAVQAKRLAMVIILFALNSRANEHPKIDTVN
ncbi:MAG: hypothetical protein JST15_01955 [Bacteroidetes bacterium]|nr:hypothetical protein [Bacteroidota bacterium]